MYTENKKGPEIHIFLKSAGMTVFTICAFIHICQKIFYPKKQFLGCLFEDINLDLW